MLFLQRMRRKKILSQISKKNLTLKLKLKTIREQLAQLKYQKMPLLQEETRTSRMRLLTNIQPTVMVQTQKAKKTSERAVILIWTIKSVGEFSFQFLIIQLIDLLTETKSF